MSVTISIIIDILNVGHILENLVYVNLDFISILSGFLMYMNDITVLSLERRLTIVYKMELSAKFYYSFSGGSITFILSGYGLICWFRSQSQNFQLELGFYLVKVKHEVNRTVIKY
ncbi:hypothetical protein CONCODRAFT_11777 [Conidiobolus coronatus NRRL 28638]|uniref:Uncharacterized protein n=1 Tax=Conidiobolus coronatus (strain ATCC 28846 / CBS 209.66 / NRRL 28638) TaxID=796925 RepID=A0A137NUG9_CONC2|nr:hypothetical protein CONCODRAFT_11777 [Conidiobolus coronatus NRRL 28638]|eukprot:KXN66396.1 hypothetical protein CONCODRAFT_11777 [Conidiobolus coronatus NRRL 28638]